MLYVGFMDNEGMWDRYQCDNPNGKEKGHFGFTYGLKRRVVTDGLASCMSVSIVSRTATLKAHIPPYLCPIIKGDKHDKGMERQLKNLKAALKKTLNDHKKALHKATTIVVAGPESRGDIIHFMLDKLFDADSSFIKYKLEWSVDPSRNDRSTVVDLTAMPPKFYIEGCEVPYTKGRVERHH